MKSIMLMAFLIISFQAGADDSIHSIVRGQAGEPHLVKFNSGEVKFIEQGQEDKLAAFEAKFNASKKSAPQFDNKMMVDEGEVYTPTPVADSEIPAIWARMNPYMKRRSECTDRAHVWTYDEFQRNGTKSQKAFLLLTDTYIKRVRYKWWFHVAPMYTTTTGKKIVMDYQFLDHPVTYTEWKNLLVFSKRECVTDFQWAQYDAGADQTQDCYQSHEAMYFYIPQDIGLRQTGRGKTGWSMGEVNGARSRAFFKGSL